MYNQKELYISLKITNFRYLPVEKHVENFAGISKKSILTYTDTI